MPRVAVNGVSLHYLDMPALFNQRILDFLMTAC